MAQTRPSGREQDERGGAQELEALFPGPSELAGLMRSYHWAKSPLGPPTSWPQSLKTAIHIMLTSRQPIWIGWGRELTYFYNDPYKAIIGGKHPWALGQPTAEVWREIWSEISPLLAKAMQGQEGTYDEAQLLIMERNGYPEETYYTFSYSPIPAEDGTAGGIFCANTDDTQRVMGERQLALLRELATATSHARSWQQACQSAAAALSTNARDLPFAMIYVVTPGGQTASLAGESGRSGVLVAGLNPFRLFDDAYAGFLDLVAGQIASAIANAEAYEQERRRAEALAEIDRAKTTFFSNISHEFRTPLTLMLGPLEELLSGPGQAAPPGERQLVSVAHRNGMRLLKLVNALLDFSRIEAGRVQASFEPVDLAAFTAELAATFRSAIDRAGLALRVECPALPATVHVDRDMWEKIVFNLLSNALKFTFNGEIAVTVRPSADGRQAELLVRDTGTGVPVEELPHLFERFHRVEGARGRSIEGSGIGLALVQELVRLHGGQAGVRSEVGSGSTFTVSLPFGTAHLPAERLRAPRRDAPVGMRAEAYVQEAVAWLGEDGFEGDGPAAVVSDDLDLAGLPQQGRDHLVLLADDNPDMRRYLERLLRAAGYRVQAVGDGSAALAAAQKRKPDIILSDVMMPRLDGFGLLAAVRAEEALQDTPFVMLSARAGEEASVEGLRAGADDYLVKPFSARELLARLETNLRMAVARRETARLLSEEAETLELLNEVGTAVAAELELDRAVQVVTDAATRLSGAAFGSFFYNVVDDKGGSYTLYTLSGAPREAFAGFPMPRNTALFGPTFKGEGIVRSADITKDLRFGRNEPYRGMPKGHLPVCSYLAVPVVSRTSEVLGGMFFGHPQAGVFDDRAERVVAAIAVQAAIAIDKARLYQAAQDELARRRGIEEALRQSEQSLEGKVRERTAELAAFQQLVHGVRDYALFMLDPNGIVTNWNPGAERIKGYRAREIVGQHFSRFYTPDDRAAGVPVRALATAAEKGSFEAEGIRVRKDGSEFWASVVINPIRSEDGTLLGFAKITRDVTERREAQQALQRAHEQLAQAQKMEGIGQLTGGVAHDFNNLLTVIIGNLESMQRALQAPAADTERLLRAADNAMRGAQRGASLTQRLLAFSRRQPLDPKPVDVGRLVVGMSDLLRRSLGEQIAIETVLSGGLWRVLADPNQLEISILNLAVNARDAMESGGKLTIET